MKDFDIDIILHTFYKSFPNADALAKLCKTIYFYERKPNWKLVDSSLPLYIQSRRNDQLVALVSKDNDSILFDGFHTTFHFDDRRWKHKRKFIRMHNIESDYYDHLASIETNIIKKMYYKFEANRSKKFELSILPKANKVFAISQSENTLFQKMKIDSMWLPPAIDVSMTCKIGIGDYLIYHGDLSIKENENSAIFLVNLNLQNIDCKLKIAGSHPSEKLKSIVRSKSVVELIPNPSQEKMDDLIANAQIILVPFSQSTGYKTKLLVSITKGRHILSSDSVQTYHELIPLIHYADSNPANWIEIIKKLVHVPFLEKDISARKNIIQSTFDPNVNVKKMIEVIF